MINWEEVALVEANLIDYDFFYNLKCEPNNIYWGGFAAKPDYANLKKWYNNIIINKIKDILVIKWNEQNVGYITFKIYDDSFCDDFSIAVSDQFGGKGIATFAIEKMDEYLKDKYPECKIFFSFIRIDNIPSQKAHKKAGFILTEEYEDKFLESDKQIIRMQKWMKCLK